MNSASPPPLLSICVPTYNREEMLDHCLGRLHELSSFGIDFEVVVSDNASSDETARVVNDHARHIRTRYCNQPIRCDPYHGFVNAIRNASGRFIVYLADDDALIFKPMVAYLQRLERDHDLAAIFADWIAWDDENEREMHRYFQFSQPAVFGPGNPLDVANFIIGNIVFTEMGIIRREALLRSDCLGARIHTQAQRWAYRLSRTGKIAFELEPFYLEHRIVKSRFRRGVTDNLKLRLLVIGDEMRNELETILLWAIHDSGITQLPDSQLLVARQLIDRFLNSRIELEIHRAISEKNWLLALDLRRRYVLWYGPGSADLRRRDVIEIALPAALQVVHDAYFNLSGVTGLSLVGFSGNHVADFFRLHYPDVRLLPADAQAPAPGRRLVLAKHADAAHARDGYRFALDSLLEQYTVGPGPVALGDL